MSICDICKKNEATIRIQRFMNGKLQVINVCAECANKEQENLKSLAGDIDIEQILSNIKKITEKLNIQPIILNETTPKKQNSFSDLVCPKCHWTIEKMEQNHGFLGCDECYKTFQKIVTESIENIHRCKIHTGKRPLNISEDDSELVVQEKILQLENDLKVAITEENYEQAAFLRDEISILKKSRGGADNVE